MKDQRDEASALSESESKNSRFESLHTDWQYERAVVIKAFAELESALSVIGAFNKVDRIYSLGMACVGSHVMTEFGEHLITGYLKDALHVRRFYEKSEVS